MAGPFDDDFDLGKVSQAFKGRLGPVFKRIGPLFAIVIAAGVLFLGTYEVGPGEQAVIRTFGRETGKAGPGLHFSFPLVQQRDVVNVERVQRVEIGISGPGKRAPDEALMLTGDENIVEAQMIVQYRISDTSKYLFRLKDPDETLRATAEVALRSMVGQTVIDELLTTGREKVQDQARAWLQKLMDDYQSGITVTELKLQAVDAPTQVREAFHDVVRAREEKEKLINEARGYQADVIPRAKGEAEKLQREAEAYREQRILRANGDANRFDATLVEFQKAERVTRQRLWLEAVERVLGSIENKVFVDEGVGKGAVPILPLPVPGAVPAGGKP
jgi:membrane protease subunit HflK